MFQSCRSCARNLFILYVTAAATFARCGGFLADGPTVIETTATVASHPVILVLSDRLRERRSG